MQLSTGQAIAALSLALAHWSAAVLAAEPQAWVPASPSEVLVKLPARATAKPGEDRSKASGAADALDNVRHNITLHRQTQDIRYLGRAQALLVPLQATDPQDTRLWVLQATIAQALHRFDEATATLKRVVAQSPKDAQAWLTLANLHRIAGRYAEALRACSAVKSSGQAFYGQACEWELRSLQGEHEAATLGLQDLTRAVSDRETRAWLLSLLAEAHERAGQPSLAKRAFQNSLAVHTDTYTQIAFADHLLAADQAVAALALLQSATDSDAVMLRRLRASKQLESGTGAKADALKSQARALEQRLKASSVAHGRELAYLQLWVLSDAKAAWASATENLQVQQEPIDWLLAMASAKASRNTSAQQALLEKARSVGFKDQRLVP